MAGQPLRRTISLPQGVALYLGSVIGAGVLILPGASATMAGPAAVLAWLFNSVLGIPLALTFAAMAGRMSDAGGVATYAAKAFGRDTGAVVGWFYLIGAATAQAAVALTGAYYAAPYLGLGRGGVFLLAGVVLVVATASNARGLRVSGRLQLLFSATVAALLTTAIVVSAPHVEAARWTPFAPHGFGAVGEVAVLIFFAFFGWEAIAHLSEEFRNPARDVPRSTFIAIAVITVLFAGVVVVTVGTGTYGSDEVNRAVITHLLGDALGDGAGAAAAAIALFIALGTVNAFVAATSRLGYALARDGAAPRVLSRVDTRGVPLTSVLVVGGYAGLCLVAAHAVGWGPEALLTIPNALVVITYLSAMIAGVKLLTGARRALAAVASVLCAVLLPFAGWALLIPLVVGAAVLLFLKSGARRGAGVTRR
ncbi:MAG: amino acid permease [Saccharothrix sp.]|nr:amino acid permease [Saccharothrix sp.]